MKYFLYTVISVCLTTIGISQTQVDTWQTLHTNYSDVSGIIHTPAQDTVFIHRIDGSLIRSFDGGASWDSVFIRHDSTYFSEMGSFFLNGKIGFTWSLWSCMYTGGVKQERPMLLKTTNSGSTWLPIMNGLSQDSIVISLVHFWDKDRGFAIGASMGTMNTGGHNHGGSSGHRHMNHIYMTMNGGANWLMNMMPGMDTITYTPRMVSFSDQYNGIMGGKEIDFNYSLTTDGGFEWKNNAVHQFNYNATGVKLIDAQHGFVIANDSIYISSDSLHTFSRKKLPFINYNNTVLANNASFYTYDNNTSYFLTFNDHIYKTTDGFNTFEVSKTQNGQPNYSMSGVGKEVYVYATNGNVYKTSIITGIEETITDKKQGVTLFPNPPTGDIVNYKSSQKITSYAIMTVVGSLVEKKKTESTAINIANLPHGSYLISFFDENNKLISTEKLVKFLGK